MLSHGLRRRSPTPRFAAAGLSHPAHEFLKSAARSRTTHQPYDPWPAGPSSRAGHPSWRDHRLLRAFAASSCEVRRSIVNSPPPSTCTPPDPLAALRRLGTIVVFGVLPTAALVMMLGGRALRRLALRRLPPRDLPAGEADAGGTEPVPAARLRPDRRAELHLAAARRVPCRPLTASAARRGGHCDARPRARRHGGCALDRRCFATGVSTDSSSSGPRCRARCASPTSPPRSASCSRSRGERVTGGSRRRLALGLAMGLKFLVWPLGVWLAATRRYRAPSLAPGSPPPRCSWSSPMSRSTTTRGLARAARARIRPGLVHASSACSCRAAPRETSARIAMWAVGLVLLAATWRYRSFTLAIAAALTLSPIVWLDYFAVAMVPLAIARPRLAWVWFLPLATWGLSGAGLGIGDPWDIGRLLVAFGIVFAVAFRDEPDPSASARHHSNVSPLTRTLELVAFGVVPLTALVVGLSTFSDQNRIALDFHHELYPQARAVVHGDDPYPAPDADLSDGTNAIWPMAAVLPVVPLTALPAGGGRLGRDSARAPRSRGGTLGARRSRLEGVRDHAALAACDRRISDRKRDAFAGTSSRAHLAPPQPHRGSGDRARRRARTEVLPLACAPLACGDSPGKRCARRNRRRCSLPPPPPALYEHRRLFSAASQPERHVRCSSRTRHMRS